MDGKSGFWGVIIAAIITGGISYYIYYDNKKVEEKKEKDMIAKIEKEKRNSIARIYIDELFLPSINTKLDSVFYLKLSNDSFNNAKNLDIKINFGGTNVNNCEIQPNLNTKGTLDNSIFKYSVKELKIKDSIYFYCTLSNPIFDNILINGSNLKNDIKLTFNEYKTNFNKIIENKDNIQLSFYEVIFRILLVVFGVYFSIVTMTLINRRLSLN